MEWTTARALLLALAAGVVATGTTAWSADENQPANARQVQPVLTPVRSTRVFARGMLCRLEGDGSRLFMVSERAGDAARPPERVDVDLNLPEGSTVKQCLLTPWSLGRLLGVVKVREGEEYAFYSLQFWPETETAPRFGSKFWSKRLHSSPENLRILAANGDFTFDSILVVLGTFAQAETGEKYVQSGIIFNHDCPTPPISGTLSRFSAEVLEPTGESRGQ